jgi:hypothetical protein
MPLPFADKPKNSTLYNDVKGVALDELTIEQLDSSRDKLFSSGQDGSEDEYRRLLLLGSAANKLSLSGVIPGTQQIIQATYTSTSDDAIFFRPEKNTVFQLVGGDTLGTGGTGSIQWQLRDDSGVICLLFQTSVSGQEPIGQNSTNNNLMTPIYITYENYLYADISAVSTSVRATLSFIRVR